MDKKKVLIVDDEETVTKSLAMLLNDEYDVKAFTTHTCGVDSLKWLQENNVDYAIVDLLINGVSGIDITNALLQKEKRARIMIITGCSTDSKEYERAKEMTINNFNVKMCNKPFNDEGEKFTSIIRKDLNEHIAA